MNDCMNEFLFALVDGETDELEVRRLLNELDKDEELRATWQRYQTIGALMRGEAASTVDLSRGIMQAIDGEPMDEVAQPATAAHATAGGRMRWLASGAVAASVTLAVLLGVRGMQGDDQALMVADGSDATPVVQAPVSVTRLAAADGQPLNEQQLEEAQRKLQEYVLQHTEQATLPASRGMMPYARVVNFATEEEKR